MMAELISFIQSRPDIAIAFATVALAALTVVSIIGSLITLFDNKKTRRLMSEPNVVAYIRPSDENINIFNFTIKNTGQGLARTVECDIISGHDLLRKKDVKFFDQPDRKPISVLPSGEKYETFLTMSFKIFQEPELDSFSVKISYKDGKSKKKFETIETIYPSQFRGMSRADGKSLREISKNIEKIAKNIDDIASGRKFLKSHTFDDDQYERAKAKRTREDREDFDGAPDESRYL